MDKLRMNGSNPKWRDGTDNKISKCSIVKLTLLFYRANIFVDIVFEFKYERYFVKANLLHNFTIIRAVACLCDIYIGCTRVSQRALLIFCFPDRANRLPLCQFNTIHAKRVIRVCSAAHCSKHTPPQQQIIY